MKQVYFISTLFLLLLNKSISQDILFEQSIKIKKGLDENRISNVVKDPVSGDMGIFLSNVHDIHAFRLNQLGSVMDTCYCKGDKKPFDYIGSVVDPGGYHLHYSNDKHDLVFTKTVDFKTGNCTNNIHKINFDDEKYISSIREKGLFYVLSVVDKSSVLKLYTIDGNKLINSQSFDLSKLNFSPKKKINLSSALKESSAGLFDNSFDVEMVSDELPNFISLTSAANKVYTYNHKLYLTIDNNEYLTQIISIDLDTFSHKVKIFKKGNIACKKSEYETIKSNSYIHKDLLFQADACDEEICFSIYNLQTDSLLKRYNVSRDEEIPFKNSSFIQEGGVTIYTADLKKELKNTDKILSKISKSKIGISVFEKNDTFIVTIGGYKEVTSRSPGIGMMVPMGGGVMGTIGMGMGMTSQLERTVYFKSMFEKNSLKHIEGSVSPNAIDKVYKFSKNNSDYFVAECHLRSGDDYLYGYYDKKEKKYFLRKFRDD